MQIADDLAESAKNLNNESTTEQVSIYDYSTFAAFFTEYMRRKRQHKQTFSYRSLSRKLKLKSPSKLSMIASNRRFPDAVFLAKLCTELGLTADETQYAETLVALQKARSPSQKKLLIEKLSDLRPATTTKVIDYDTFSLISEWYHLAVLGVLGLEEKRDDPAWIAGHIEADISATAVARSLEMLKRLEMLADSPTEGLKRTSGNFVTPNQVPHDAGKLFHGQMLDLAKAALFAQDVNERFFSATNIAIDPEKIPEAQELLDEFRQKFIKLMETGRKKSVYHLSLQFFRLTARPEGDLEDV